MNSGKSCVDFTIVQGGRNAIMLGLARPTLSVDLEVAHATDMFWGVCTFRGHRIHHDRIKEWAGRQACTTDDVVRMLLDSDAGTLAVRKNGSLLGSPFTSGLIGDLCWAIGSANDDQCRVRIEAVDPADFGNPWTNL